MTTTIPCRAQHPATCKYHGAEQRATTALDEGDIDAYLIAQAEMTAAIKTTPEIIDFFNDKKTADLNQPPVFALTPEQRPAVLLPRRLRRAEVSLDDRIQFGIGRAENFHYTVGGTPNDIEHQKYTTARTVYQATAEKLLGLANLEPAPGGGNEWGVNKERLERALDLARNDHLDDVEANPSPDGLWGEVDIAHRYGFKVLTGQYENPVAPGGRVQRVPLRRLMHALDRAYWEQPDPTYDSANTNTPLP